MYAVYIYGLGGGRGTSKERTISKHHMCITASASERTGMQQLPSLKVAGVSLLNSLPYTLILITHSYCEAQVHMD